MGRGLARKLPVEGKPQVGFYQRCVWSKSAAVKGRLELRANPGFHPDYCCLGEWNISECVSSRVERGHLYLLRQVPEGDHVLSVGAAVSKTACV